MPNITQITPPRVPLIDERTGAVSREWYRWFYNLYYATGGTTGGAIPTDRGGTGTTQVPTDGQILVGDTATQAYNVTDLGTGDGIAKTIGPGVLSIENTGVLSNTGGDGISVDQATGDVTVTNTGVLSNIGGSGISVDQATGNVTVTNTGVLSVIAGNGISVNQPTGNVTVTNDGVLSFSGGTTGLTPATATTGAVVLAGTLDVDNGGTGQTSYTNGQLLIGNTTGNTLTKSTLTAGSGITITNGAGSITIAASGGGTATNADNIKTVSTATNANFFLTFVDSNNGTAAYEAVYTDAGVTYNPSTNAITSGISGGTF